MSLVDGFDLKFVSRTQSAERRHNGRLIDTIPVAWTASWRSGPAPVAPDALPGKAARRAQPPQVFVEIAFNDPADMAAQQAKPVPFVVALAEAKPKTERSRGGAADFRGVFEVTPTGVQLSPTSLETRVIRRVLAGQG
jgi:hypothetical protein